ncbi:uracil DNA glycosylase superfamily protein [Mumia flava]|uniref:Uracil DNA glycosylase superfamily protein n=1 Tax=Mumia flava TaxID=1348852 RepID=A0A2M9B732_9ACTN|nr:uracil-DNA glycosylase [Mumia flava]PJJ53738.1 uracil DNA glycosylase superfamily protein [Mumia flava]
MTILNRGAYDAGLLLDDTYIPGSIAARRARADDPHVAPLNALARDIGERLDEHVPQLDPESGGTKARVLLLQRDPYEVAAIGTRMISRHNNDRTDGNTFAACEEAGLAYADTLHWNVIPWWAQDPAKAVGGKDRSVAGEARRAAPYLRQTLDLLPNLDTVVLLGNQARTAWARAAGALPELEDGLRVLACPHPSPRAWSLTNAGTGEKNGEITLRVLREAAGAGVTPPVRAVGSGR